MFTVRPMKFDGEILMCTHRWSLLIAVAVAWLNVGCVAVPQRDKVKEVYVCNDGVCEGADQKYTAAQLGAGLQRLLKENEGQKATICDSNARRRTCDSIGVCYFVLGGIIPGNGCAQNIVFREIAVDKQSGQVTFKADMPLTFIGTPLFCATATGTLSPQPPGKISIEFERQYCNWMAVGNMFATFTLSVESLDLNHGRIGGYWSHAVEGTGNGKGSGYMVMQFPTTLPAGRNWFADQSELTTQHAP